MARIKCLILSHQSSNYVKIICKEMIKQQWEYLYTFYNINIAFTGKLLYKMEVKM